MSISILPNQALATAEDTTGKCNTKYALPSQRNDNFTLQGITTPTNNDELSNFLTPASWYLGTGWDSGPGFFRYNGTAGSITYAQSSTFYLQPGNLYQFCARIIVTNAGGCGNNEGLQLFVGGIQVPMPDALPGHGTHQSYNVTWWHAPVDYTTGTVKLTFNKSTIAFEVQNISVYQYSIPLIAAYNTSGNFVQSITPVSINYINTTSYTGFVNATDPLRFDMKFNLNQLSDGCYSLKIYDGASNVLNGNFDGDDNWVAGTNWTIADNKASYSGSDASHVLLTDIYVHEGITYTLQLHQAGLTSSGGMEIKVQFTDNLNSTHTANYTGINSHGFLTFQFTPPAGATGLALLSFIPLAQIEHTCNFSLSNLMITFNNPVFISNKINFRTSWPQTHLFSATNNDAAFNFDYSLGLTHTIRLVSKMKYKEYDEEVNQYNFSDNSNVLMTASSEKVYEILIADAAEFVHDCLSIMRLHDSFYVDGAEHIRTGNYTLKQRKSTELSSAGFDIKPIAGVSKNWAIG